MEKIDCSQNTDKTIYTEKHSDHWGSFNDSLFITEEKSIGINVAGLVYVMPLKKWHELAKKEFPIGDIKQ